MTLATQPKLMLEDYLDYNDGTDKHYELVDGVLVEMTGEDPLNPAISPFLFSCFLQLGIPHYRLTIGHQIAVIEVVSSSDKDKTSYRRDYEEKRNEYAEWGIP